MELDITKLMSKLRGTIVYGLDLEDIIVSNYSTNRFKQSKVYIRCMQAALDYLVDGNRGEPVQLFEILDERDFNLKFMNIVDLLEYYVVKVVGPLYIEVNVKSVNREDGKYILQLEVL